MKPLIDDAGVEIRVGDIVRQAYVFDSGRGALMANAARTGTVVGLGRVRVKVDFDRTKLESFGRVASDEPIIDNVAADLLTVISTKVDADHGLRTGGDRGQ